MNEQWPLRRERRADAANDGSPVDVEDDSRGDLRPGNEQEIGMREWRGSGVATPREQ